MKFKHYKSGSGTLDYLFVGIFTKIHVLMNDSSAIFVIKALSCS